MLVAHSHILDLFKLTWVSRVLRVDTRRIVIYLFKKSLMQKTILTILGVVFLAIGVLGFVSDPLLGIFEVDSLHNIIHILSGALALVAVSMGASAMNTFSRVFGIVYALVAVLGFVSGDNVLGLIMVNAADNVLHLVLAVVFLYLGFGHKEGASSM